jgi:hypothetical protein
MGGAGDTTAWNARSFWKLRKFLVAGDHERSIVVTHRAPSIKSIADRYRKDHLSAAFASKMDELILEHQPHFWIHGHTHEIFDCHIGNICNRRGYAPIDMNKGWTMWWR